MRILRLVWEFRGMDAQQIAAHHLQHLNEYLNCEGIEVRDSGVQEHSEMYASAYLICEEAMALKLREPLKPHAAYLEEN